MQNFAAHFSGSNKERFYEMNNQKKPTTIDALKTIRHDLSVSIAVLDSSMRILARSDSEREKAVEFCHQCLQKLRGILGRLDSVVSEEREDFGRGSAKVLAEVSN